MTILGLQSFGRFRAERRFKDTHGWAPGFDGVVPTLMRTLGISRGYTLSSRAKGLDQS